MKRPLFVLLLLVAALAAFFAGRGAWRSPDVAAQSKDTLDNYILRVEIDGIAQSFFRGVEGLDVETDVLEFREGQDPTNSRKLPGPVHYRNVTLRFDPVPHGDSMWTWYTSVLQGKVAKRNMSIILATKDGKDVRRYNFFSAWPCKWTGPRQVSPSSAVPVEEVCIAYDRMERTTR